MNLRHIHPINISDLKPTAPSTGEPIFETVDPTTLFIDPEYQRDIGERGLRQIRKMIEHWDWSKFRAPVCAFEKGDDPPGRVSLWPSPMNWRPAFAKLTPERRHFLKKQAERA